MKKLKVGDWIEFRCSDCQTLLKGMVYEIVDTRVVINVEMKEVSDEKNNAYVQMCKNLPFEYVITDEFPF